MTARNVFLAARPLSLSKRKSFEMTWNVSLSISSSNAAGSGKHEGPEPCSDPGPCCVKFRLDGISRGQEFAISFAEAIDLGPSNYGEPAGHIAVASIPFVAQ
jgi:hypothetical protein